MSIRLVAGALALSMGLPALAQNLETMELFAPADVSTYGSGIQPKEGYFFSLDWLNWYISKPDVAVIGNDTPGERSRLVYNVGNPDTAWTQTNSHDTGAFESAVTNGNRIEFGRVCDRQGWMVGIYNLRDQTQRFVASDVNVVFADDDDWGDPSGGRLQGPIVQTTPGDPTTNGPNVNLPVIFDEMTVVNRVEHWNVELMCLHRTRPFHYGGYFEFFAGVRYFEFDESFGVDARRVDDPNAATPPNNASVILANSLWDTMAENHVIGPQAGVRWFKQSSRWMFSTEARFLAGYNLQNLSQTGILASEINPIPSTRVLGEPALMLATPFDHVDHEEVFSPVVELRAELRYQFTRAVSFRAGWTGMWMDGIARASNLVDYSLFEQGVMGILADNNDRDVFIHGLTIGVDVNR
ncbi:MAG TPA: BBP7 family outer membrane beta-barrel protein [Thermoguttaceae bacterium]|nr:BBP7 family outer membrane beta-barrel protein [Thermoguttaceae bacterium]